MGLTAAMESPGGARAGTSGSPWGRPVSLPPGLEQDEEWEQLMSGRLSVSCDHIKGMLLVLGGHQLLLQGFYKGIKFSDILLVHSQLLW